MPFLRPALCCRRITDLTAEQLRTCSRLPVRLLLLDVDNTLSRHGEKEPAPGVEAWVRRMEQAGFLLLILSNNTKKRVAPFAAKLGIPFMSRCAKPLPLCYLLACRRIPADGLLTAARAACAGPYPGGRPNILWTPALFHPKETGVY